MKKNSVKNRRINDEVRRSLSDIIRNDLKDPRVSPFVSILEAEVATDLKTCKVWFSVMGDKDEGKRTLDGLNSAKGFIRTALAHDVNLRNTPELTFIPDTSYWDAMWNKDVNVENNFADFENYGKRDATGSCKSVPCEEIEGT